MNKGLIPTRYAKALFQYAQENNAENTVYQEVLQITKICETEKRIRAVLKNPLLAKQNKAQIIRAIAGENISPVFSRFIDVLIENERDNLLQRICLCYIDLYRKKNNIHLAKLTTVAALDPAAERRIVDLIKSVVGGTIETVSVISPELLGGFIVDVDSNRWDASLAGQLRRIKMEFSVNNQKR
ncbi:MAG: F0F1 ATP synthase subunit delta [Paludibacter sp.]|nr:F0F1 ATP synthase subunit delta [Paludibacter sp.]